MKIAVLTAVSRSYKEMGDLVHPNKQAYCDKHGYDYIIETDYPDKHFDKIPQGGKCAEWHKILIILKYLDQYDYIWWTDCDTLFMNDAIKLETYIDDKSHIIIGVYAFHQLTLFHTGNWIIKNSPEAKEIIREIYYGSEYARWNNFGNNEEGALFQYYEKKHRYYYLIKPTPISWFSAWLPEPAINTPLQYAIHYHEAKKYAHTFPYINKFLYFIFIGECWYTYKRGDFILHSSSPASYIERVQFLKYIVEHWNEFV